MLGMKHWTAVESKITILDNNNEDSWDATTFSGNKNKRSDNVEKNVLFSSNDFRGKSVKNATIFK